MPEGFSIGRLAALTGLPVRTVCFYSDAHGHHHHTGR